jgi:hypothetical protein
MKRDKGTRRAAVIPEFSAEPTIDRPSQNRIGDHLRAMYDGLMQQPVPDRFVDLINRLEKSGDGQGTR